MIIDLILDRRAVEMDDTVYVSPTKMNDFYVPIAEVYPVEDVPEAYRNSYCYSYNPKAFYHAIYQYGDVGDGITLAMDYGTEKDVKRELCAYIDNNDYSPDIKDYINSVNWLDV